MAPPTRTPTSARLVQLRTIGAAQDEFALYFISLFRDGVDRGDRFGGWGSRRPRRE